MAFPREQTRVPVAVADISIQLFSPDPTGSESAGADYAVQIRYNTGEVKIVRGNLVTHLSPAQINGLLSFMADMRVKAIAEILP